MQLLFRVTLLATMATLASAALKWNDPDLTAGVAALEREVSSDLAATRAQWHGSVSVTVALNREETEPRPEMVPHSFFNETTLAGFYRAADGDLKVAAADVRNSAAKRWNAPQSPAAAAAAEIAGTVTRLDDEHIAHCAPTTAFPGS